MDKKKILGTIIGVIMFVALIVGATYAWLSFTANVNNTTINGSTMNYWVNYVKGAGLSDMPILTSPTTSNTSVVTVSAQRPKGSLADTITIHLTTTSDNDLTTSGAVKYVICQGECASDFSDGTIGSVTANGTVDIFTGTLPGTADSSTNTTVNYYIYFWLDAATITNAHLGDTYTGYIHASSVQQ